MKQEKGQYEYIGVHIIAVFILVVLESFLNFSETIFLLLLGCYFFLALLLLERKTAKYMAAYTVSYGLAFLLYILL